MGKDYGTPAKYDPDFQGPIHNRSCTDIFWLIVFILFLGVWGYLGYYSISKGQIDNLLAPIDSEGKRCGLDSGLEDKKYLVFFDITKCLNVGTPFAGCQTPQVCVKTCPKTNRKFSSIGGFSDLTHENFQQLKKEMVCVSSVNMETLDYTSAVNHINNGNCAAYVLTSEPVLFRCMGDLSALQCKDTKAGIGRDADRCVRDPKFAQESLLTRATVLDSYVGWSMASWVTFFTTNASERETHIVVLRRCLVNYQQASADVEAILQHFTNQTALEVITDFSEILKLQQLSSQVVEDLVNSRWYMVGALVAVVVICFIYILLLRWVVSPVVWTSIVGLIALLGYCLYLCYKQYKYYTDHPVLLHQTNNLKGIAESWFTKPSTWMVIMIALAITILVLILIVIFLRGRIVIAIALIREGSKAVTAIKTTVFFPIIPWILQCGLIAYAVLIFMYLQTLGTPAYKAVNVELDTDCRCEGIKDNDVCNVSSFNAICHSISTGGPCTLATCHYMGIDTYSYVLYLHLLNLLGFFWTMFFVSGVADMMLASTFSTWYWTFKKKNLPFFTLTGGICRTLCYHLGTVALGSLIIAIVRVIRVILEYVDHKLKKFDNPFTRCILCCCKCFFWCLENFLKFINKNAYIMCAVHGKNFCTSARDAFSLLMRNIVRVVVLDKVTDFIFFLSKLLISIGVGVSVYYLMQWKVVFQVTKGEPLNYSYIPAIILSIATYLICTVFFNVYSMAVDTLFLCFLEDCERNDGSAEKPYFMSKNLMRILGKKNKRD